jgi:hypothetical protein
MQCESCNDQYPGDAQNGRWFCSDECFMAGLFKEKNEPMGVSGCIYFDRSGGYCIEGQDCRCMGLHPSRTSAMIEP